MPTRPALVVGESLIDIVRRTDGRVTEHQGGSPANVAVTLGKLGRPVELATWYGHGPYGDMLRRWFRTANVEIVPGSDGAISTSVATAVLSDDGDAEYTFDFAYILASGAADAVGPATPCVHVGSLAAVDRSAHADVVGLMTTARSSATTTYDPNVRPSLMGDVTEARARVEAIIDTSDVVKVSAGDLAWLAPGADAVATARSWLSRGPALVVLTRGADGAIGMTADATVSVEAPSVDVVDTVGAGDAFMGGLIDALWTADLLGAGHRSALRRVSDESLTAILRHAAKVAALAVTRPGANPPSRTDLDRS